MAEWVVRAVRGDTWRRTWFIETADGNPVSLAGATARLAARTRAGQVVLTASTTDGRIVLNPDQGRIDLVVPAAAMRLPAGRYPFDLEVTFPDGRVQTYEQAVLLLTEDHARE